MANIRLIVEEAGKEPREIEIFGEVTTFGRVTDNSVAFTSDTNISRYHAQIARRGDEFYVSDFGSSNGTSVNGEPLTGERPLKHNDKINFGGGGSFVTFLAEPSQQNEFADDYAPGFSVPPAASATNSASAAPPTGGLPIALTAAAVLSGVAIVTVASAIIYFWADITGSCTSEVVILRPETGVTLTEAMDVQVSVKNPQCIDRVSYLIDGEELETVEVAPYAITIDPAKFEKFKDDDSSHVLTVMVYDKDGGKKLQKEQTLLAFASPPKNTKDKPQQPGRTPSPNTPPTNLGGAEISLAETKMMSEALLRQLTQNSAYKFDPQFLREVQRKTVEYRTAEGFYDRAVQHRDVINQTFILEQNLSVPLGYILAMSRSGYENKRGTGNAEGLWQMTNDFAASNGYNGQCGAETLSDVRQNCAARAAAIYTKALVNIFQGDVVYSAASFGLSPAEAGQFAITLPADRSDFWNAVRNPKQRETLVRFFAAGIVAENPEKFGLKRDKKLSEVYKNLLIFQ